MQFAAVLRQVVAHVIFVQARKQDVGLRVDVGAAFNVFGPHLLGYPFPVLLHVYGSLAYVRVGIHEYTLGLAHVGDGVFGEAALYYFLVAELQDYENEPIKPYF